MSVVLALPWVYGIIFAVIIGYNLFRTTSGTGVEIDNTQFYTMLRMGDVKEIKTVGNKKIVRITIYPQKLDSNQAFYQKIFGG